LTEVFRKQWGSRDVVRGVSSRGRASIARRLARRTPNAVYRYFPLIPRIRQLWSHPFFAEKLKHGMESYRAYKEGRHDVDHCTDIHTSPAWAHVVRTLGESVYHLAFGLSADAATTGTFNRGESITPICLSVLNLPRHMRAKVDNLLTLGIPPANSKKMKYFMGNYKHFPFTCSFVQLLRRAAVHVRTYVRV
jgi:hypothetical protein